MRTTERPLPEHPDTALAQARIVVAALIGGVVLFWVVGLVLDTRLDFDPPPGSGMTPRLALIIWAVLAAGTLPIALLFRNRAAGRADAWWRSGAVPTPTELAEVTTNVILAAALLEAPALFAGAMLVVLGEPVLVLYAAIVFVAGMALVFPRAEWFGAGPGRG